MIEDFMQMNLAPLGMLAFMCIIIYANKDYEPEVTKRFIAPIVLIFFLIILDNMDYSLYRLNDIGIIHRIVAFLGYNLRINLLLTLIFIVLRKNTNKYKKFLVIPATICFLVESLSLFTNWVFTYDNETGEFKRGILGYTPHIIAIFYMSILIYVGIKLIFQDKLTEGIIILFGSYLNVIATIAETLYQLEGILISTITLIVVFYYLYIHTEFFKVDVLTGTLNRLSYHADKLKYDKDIKAFIMIDLNDLKKLNDDGGHNEGDKALKTLAYVVSKCLPRKCYLYRTGGDEFMVIIRKSVREKTGVIISRIKGAMLSTQYSWAVGYCDIEDEITYHKAERIADKRMYEDKAKMKGKENIR